MALLDGGSKQNWLERLRAKTYWTIYVLIPLLVLAHIASGHPWKAWLLIGVASLGLAIWLHPRSE